ncbi:MAG: DNA replication protein [bacterium]|nr:DNA replication protein [bacterium]
MNQYVFEYDDQPAFDESEFLVADSNADARAWIDRWPDWDGRGLAIWGPEGSGKTHLADIWRQRSGARMVNAAEIGPDFFDSWQGGNLVLEDRVDGVSESSLLHVINLVREEGGYLLITDTAPPARWHVSLPDLRSRLAALPAVAIGRPEDNLIAAVLAKQFRDRQIKVSDGVISYLVLRMERSFDAIGTIVATLDLLSLVEKRPITVPRARRALEAAFVKSSPDRET